MGSEEFMEKPVQNKANPRFPTFHQNNHFANVNAKPDTLSFRKKLSSSNHNFPTNPKYASSEFFNFYGVLNFKVKKFNKVLLREAFANIYDRACDVESHQRMFAFGTIVKKDHSLLQLSRLATEVNRRFNIRNQNLFRMTKGLNTKAKNCLRILRLFRKGNFKRPTPRNFGDHQSYIGMLFLKIFNFLKNIYNNFHLKYNFLTINNGKILTKRKPQ